jgi:hypothetical protein
VSAPASGLAGRLVDWMAANRSSLDELMAQEGSRAIHEEFILAEGGTLPDRGTRIARARGASARAWMRHLGQALAAELPGTPADLPERLTIWLNANGERQEALVLEELAVLERRGASGDPEADRRDAELAAAGRLFAEGYRTLTTPDDGEGESPAVFGRRVAGLARSAEARRREIEREALDAWGASPQPPEMTAAAGTAPEPDAQRVQEAAAVWAHVRVTTEALEAALAAPPEGPEIAQDLP